MMTASLARQHLADDLGKPPAGPRTFGSWADAVRRNVLSFQFDCDQPRSFAGTISNRSLGQVSFINMASERHAAYRDRDTISAQDTGFYVMTLQLSGQLRLTQDNRSTLLKPGQFAIYDSSQPASLTASDDYTSTCIRFPKDQLTPHYTDPLGGAIATAFDCTPGLASTVWEMLISLNRNLAALGAHGPTAVRNALDLVAILLRSELGQTGIAPPGRHDLLVRVREYIDEHIDDPELDPERIAAAHYISRRHLHKLFTQTDSTVAQWIRDRRIELCRRDLADPTMASLPIVGIAARRGFANPSHFSHLFKQSTGQTPAEYRRWTIPAVTDSPEK